MNDNKTKKSIDELLDSPCMIIDILPMRVPENSPGQFFAIEKYFLKKERLDEIKQKHASLILKLNCYRRISIDCQSTGGEEIINPAPDIIAEEICQQRLFIRVDDAMILSEPDETHMTLFNPDKSLKELIEKLSFGEGLFLWEPQA